MQFLFVTLECTCNQNVNARVFTFASGKKGKNDDSNVEN